MFALALFCDARCPMLPHLGAPHPRVCRCRDEAIVEKLLEFFGDCQPSDWLDPNKHVPGRVMYGGDGFRSACETLHRWYTSDEMLSRMFAYAEASAGTSSQRHIARETGGGRCLGFVGRRQTRLLE